MKRQTSRQIQAEQTKQHILDTVAAIMSEKSFDEMNIQEICKKANISVGAFYHHFENKAALIIEIYKDVDVFFQNEIWDIVKELEPIEAILEYLKQQCKYAEEAGCDVTKNLYKAQIDNGNLFYLSIDRGLPQGLQKLVTKACEQGLLYQDVHPEQITKELLILSRGIIYNWCVSNGQNEIQETVSSMAKKYLSYYICSPKEKNTFS